MGTTGDRLIILGYQLGVNIIYALREAFGLGRPRLGLRKSSEYYVKFGVFGKVGL